MASPFFTIEIPLPPPSDDPIASVMTKFGKLSRNSSLDACEKSTALDETAKSDDTSGAVLFSFMVLNSSSKGRAMASPVIMRRFTFSFSTVRHTSSALNFARSTLVLPTKLWPMMLHCVAPCMSGGMGNVVRAKPLLPLVMKS